MASEAKDGPRVLDSCLAENLGKRFLLIDPEGVVVWGGHRMQEYYTDLAVAAHTLTVGSGTSNDQA
jgi:hypothetical protein